MTDKTSSRAITIVGRSGTGKTTLLIKLVKELTGRNYRVGCIKHHHGKDFEIDHEGKTDKRIIIELAEIYGIPKERTFQASKRSIKK